MADNEPAQPAETPLPVCVRSATLQYLRSLAAAGVTDVARPDGSYSFDFGVEDNAADGSVNAVAKAADEVSEQPATNRDTTSAPTPTTKTSAPKSSAPKSSAPKSSALSRTPIPALTAFTEPYPAPLEKPERKTQLTVLADQVAGCRRCTELCDSRTQTVFGVGNVAPRLAFYGEAPGADEDRLGEPFVGAAGQLLTKIIAAMKLARDDVYIMNTVKCRPPGNRNPSDGELDNCREYADKQFEILQPEFICCLGSVAARSLLKTKQSIGRMRGKLFDYRGSKVVVTYHPAYLLRTPAAKAHVWTDMKFLLKEMGVEL